ncbi:MAG TPA: EI24 domain-containing protein [Kofleriaceae bacterium]|jgi:CysZ protein|nr:EI24 domain-containing protein [Kofleriaceae bacterium]
MQDLVRGVRDVGRGYSLLRKHSSLWGWVIAPAAVTLVLLGATIWGVLRLADPLVAKAARWLPDWLAGWASGLLWLLVVAALAIGALLVFVTIAGTVAGPFNELLSEAVEQRLTGVRGPRFSLTGFLRALVVGLVHGVRRLVVYLVGVVVVFAIAFIPVIGTIAAAVLGFLLAALSASYDCYDAVLSRRDLSYAAKQAYLRKHRARTLGLGAAVAGLLLVPVVNLAALGLGAIGATLAARELDGEPRP